MKFLKTTKSTEKSKFIYFIPAEPYNYNVVAYSESIPTEEDPEIHRSIIFETGILVQVSHSVPTQVRRSNNGKQEIVKMTPQISQEPYQVIVREEKDIDNILVWLNENVINAE